MLSLSALLCVAISLCYWLRPDSCAAVTVFPTWMWLAPGGVLVASGFSRRTKRAALGVVLLWLLFLWTFAEEPRSLLRFSRFPSPEWEAARQRGQALRVVSLNCAGGIKEAAEEAESYQPDIVLLQETPTPKHVKALAQRLFKEEAGMLCGVDVSLIARGSVIVRRDSPDRVTLRRLWFGGPQAKNLPVVNFIHAHVRLTSGIEAEVINFHPPPTPLRMDLWSLDCWRAHTEHRQLQREKCRVVARYIDSLPCSAPIIFGGDFNTPAGDAVFRLFQPRLNDAFKEGGIGWGNTFMNDMSVIRIDQIWVSEHFRTAAVVARRTKHSDHLMVICDLVVK